MPARYRKLRKIADGGMAEIFLATQHGAEGFERRVVLKQILAPLLADPKFKHMIVDEAHVAMSLNHSNRPWRR
jgi:serine/threonine-protein kinase